MKRIKETINFVNALVILTLLLFALYGVANTQSINQETSNLINNYGTPALFFISILLDLIPQIVSPLISLGAGLLAGMNIYNAISATILGSTIGSILGFMIGKRYMLDVIDILSSRKSMNKMTHLTNKYGKIIIPIAAISPLPYLPIALGAINLSKRNFIIFGLIPRALGIIAYGILFSLV